MGPLTPTVVQYVALSMLRGIESDPRTVFGLHALEVECVNHIDLLERRVYMRAQIRPGEFIEGFVPVNLDGPASDIALALARMGANFIAAETHARQVCC